MASALKEQKVNRFDLGISEQERDLSNGYYSYIENLELKTRSATQVANNTVSIADMNLRATLDVAGTMYGLGWSETGDKYVTVWSDLTGTVTPRIPSTTYTFAGKNNPFFVTDGTYIYFDNLNHIGRYKISDNSMNGDWLSISGGLNGGLWWKGDMYGFSGHDIYKVVVAGPSASNMLTIPSTQTIVKLVDYGNLMAIICTSSVEESKTYFWDGVTTTSFYDIVKIGFGTVFGGDLLDGVITIMIGLKNYKGIRIKKYNGAIFTTYLTYYGRPNLAGAKYVIGASQVKAYTNYLYFLTYATRPNSSNDFEYVVMRYGREDVNKQFNLSVFKTLEIGTGIGSLTANDFTIIEDTSPSSLIPITAVYATVLVSANVTHSSYNLKSAVYTAQAGVIETGIDTGGDSSIEKQISELSIHCEPLTSGQSIVLKYKSDADTSWTTIVTLDTVGTISYEPTMDSSGDNLKVSKELSFRLEGLGGAAITGFSYRYEPQLGQR